MGLLDQTSLQFNEETPSELRQEITDKLDQVLARLGLPAEGTETERWAVLGRRLALREPEFEGPFFKAIRELQEAEARASRPRRGRPRKSPEDTAEVSAARFVNRMQEYFGKKYSKKITVKDIAEWMNKNAKYLGIRHMDVEHRAQQVSRGRGVLRKLEKNCQQ